jgi:F0F1-type ATP synthase epsilon subunit
MSPHKLTVLAEEAFSLSDVDAATVDRRISDAKEDLLLTKTERERNRAKAALDTLTQLRAAL